MRLKRIFTTVIGVPAGLLLVAFIVANRQRMTVSFNPFGREDAGWNATAPAFVFLFAFLALGIVIGSITTWLGQHKYRKKRFRPDDVTGS